MDPADNDYWTWREENDRLIQQQAEEQQMYETMRHDPSQQHRWHGGLSVIVTHPRGWVGAHYLKPEHIDRAVQRRMDQLVIAHIMGVDTADEEPNHAA